MNVRNINYLSTWEILIHYVWTSELQRYLKHDTHPSPSLSRTSLNWTADPSEILETWYSSISSIEQNLIELNSWSLRNTWNIILTHLLHWAKLHWTEQLIPQKYLKHDTHPSRLLSRTSLNRTDDYSEILETGDSPITFIEQNFIEQNSWSLRDTWNRILSHLLHWAKLHWTEQMITQRYLKQDTHPSPSLSRTSLNRTDDYSEILETGHSPISFIEQNFIEQNRWFIRDTAVGR